MNILASATAGATTVGEFCRVTASLWQIIGYIINVMKIVVPIIIVLFGIIDLSKAVMAGKEDEMKNAQKLLIKRLIYGVAVFMIITIVKSIYGLVLDDENDDYVMANVCWNCVMKPDSGNCINFVNLTEQEKKCIRYGENSNQCKGINDSNSNKKVFTATFYAWGDKIATRECVWEGNECLVKNIPSNIDTHKSWWSKLLNPESEDNYNSLNLFLSYQEGEHIGISKDSFEESSRVFYSNSSKKPPYDGSSVTTSIRLKRNMKFYLCYLRDDESRYVCK